MKTPIAARYPTKDDIIEQLSADIAHVEHERDVWKQRANAQLEITRAALNIVLAPPFQIYDSTVGQSGYRISRAEFEDLQHAVVEYQRLNEIENARLMVQAARTEQSK